jgi:hypothetical protein
MQAVDLVLSNIIEKKLTFTVFQTWLPLLCHACSVFWSPSTLMILVKLYVLRSLLVNIIVTYKKNICMYVIFPRAFLK